jgi:ferredoxin
MTYVVTQSCIKCMYTDCVDVCPVNCFHEGPNMVVIDPDECIDCAQCVVECPVQAIYEQSDLPTEEASFIALNAEQAKLWPSIVDKRPPAADADKWAKVLQKIQFLSK